MAITKSFYKYNSLVKINMGNQRRRIRKYDRNEVNEDEKWMKGKERMRIQRAKKKWGYNKLMNLQQNDIPIHATSMEEDRGNFN